MAARMPLGMLSADSGMVRGWSREALGIPQDLFEFLLLVGQIFWLEGHAVCEHVIIRYGALHLHSNYYFFLVYLSLLAQLKLIDL